MKKFRILNHVADLEIEAWGKDYPELFSNMAYGMFDATKIRGRTKKYKPIKRVFIIRESTDYEMLLVNFLNELWYQASSNNEIYQNIKFNKFSLSGIEAEADTISCRNFELEIKSATYFDLKIEREKERYTAKVVFDI